MGAIRGETSIAQIRYAHIVITPNLVSVGRNVWGLPVRGYRTDGHSAAYGDSIGDLRERAPLCAVTLDVCDGEI